MQPPLPANVFRVEELPVQTAPAAPGFGTSWRPLPGLTVLSGAIETLEPGHAICPLHYHLLEEELIVVLEGEVTVRELPPDAGPEMSYREFAVRAGEAVVWPAGTRLPHQTRNTGEHTARYLVISDKWPQEVCVYPDSGKVAFGGVGVGIYRPRGAPPRPTDELLAEAAAVAEARAVVSLADADRPGHVQGPDRVAEGALGPNGGFGRPLSRAAGARRIFVNADRLPPGAFTSSLHAHLADEELVLVLEGNPTLRQRRGRRQGRNPVFDGPEECFVLAPGDGVRWTPGDLVAHQLLNETTAEVRLLVIGTDNRHDLVLYPERGEVLVGQLMPWEAEAPAPLPGPLGVPSLRGGDGSPGPLHVGAFEATDYFAGEVAPTARTRRDRPG